jgi:fluoride exporter
MREILLVSCGAVLGAVARFTCTRLSSELSQHHGFPYGTLLVNVVGSFIVGYVLTWTADQSDSHWRLLAATGFCGAFTTFSAFALETMAYWRDGALIKAALNVMLNNGLCLVSVVLGVSIHSGMQRAVRAVANVFAG